jgi:hypothetical protein
MSFLWFLLVLQSAVMSRAAVDLDAPVTPKTPPARKAAIEKARVAAVNFLGECGPIATPHLRSLCDRLGTPPLAPTAETLAAIEKIDPRIYKPLREYLFATNPKDKSTNLRDIEALKESAKPVLGLLAGHLRDAVDKRTDTSSFPSAQILFMFRTLNAKEDAVAAAAVVHAASDKNQLSDLRFIAVDTLVEWSTGETARQKELVPILGSGIESNSKTLKIACIKHAADLGTISDSLLPAIRKLKLSTDQEIRAAADAAVEKMEKK